MNAAILAVVGAIVVGVLLASGEITGAVFGLIALVGFAGIAVQLFRKHLGDPPAGDPEGLNQREQ